MHYQRFTIRLLLYLVFINIIGILLVYLVLHTKLWFSITGLSILFILAILSLYFYIDQIREDIKRFISAIKNRDHTLNFHRKVTKGSFPELYESFNDIIHIHKDIQLEQEAMFQLIKTILEQVPVGIIVVRKEEKELKKAEISFFNQAASQLLQIPTYKYWHRFERHLPSFSKEIEKISTGGKQFLEIKLDEKLVQLSIEVIPVHLNGHTHLIISFQNIKDEIEQKEAEAWNRLIGVISHEILNSITPISSLSDTVDQMIASKQQLEKEDLDDIRPAIQTIRRRSAGLLDFVKDYRLIAELPSPNTQPHLLSELLNHVELLMKSLVNSNAIRLEVSHTSSQLSLHIDFKLIEQALINLITNSIYALEGTKEPFIEIQYRLYQRKIYLEVSDNGKGILPENMDKIFVPFYTTRREGSGIGLTITRNILKMHHAHLEVSSIPGVRTTFSMVFNGL